MLEDSDIKTMESKRISWAGHVWQGREQTIGQVTCWKPKSKRPLGHPRQRCINRVHKDLDMLGILNGEELATDRQMEESGGKGPEWSIFSKKKF